MYNHRNQFYEIAEIITLKGPRNPSPISFPYIKRRELGKKLPSAQSRCKLDQEEEKARPKNRKTHSRFVTVDRWNLNLLVCHPALAGVCGKTLGARRQTAWLMSPPLIPRLTSIWQWRIPVVHSSEMDVRILVSTWVSPTYQRFFYPPRLGQQRRTIPRKGFVSPLFRCWTSSLAMTTRAFWIITTSSLRVLNVKNVSHQKNKTFRLCNIKY